MTNELARTGNGSTRISWQAGDAPGDRPSRAMPIRRGPLARLSIEYKLPLLIGTLLLAVIVAIAVAAYAEMRRSAMLTATTRVTSIATQFRDMFQQNGDQLRTLAVAAAQAPALAEYARARSTRSRQAALSALRYVGPQPEQVVATELRDRRGYVILSTLPASQVDAASLADLFSRASAGDSATLGLFRTMPGAVDTLILPIRVMVPNGDGISWVRWRRLIGSRRTREQLTQLIGSGASLFLGNPGRAEWTNLESIVPPPPLKAAAAGAIQTYQRGPDRATYIAALAAIPRTPWMIVVDFPLSQVMAPVHDFMRRIALIAAFALALGLGAAWIASRRITHPILRLTEAVSAITAGDYSRRVNIRRYDELGRLGLVFDTMSHQAQQARDLLERRIQERTTDLTRTLEELHETQNALVRRERLAMLGQLSSGVGHELRNPLGVMTNAVYFLRMVLASSPPNVHEYLEILQQQITLSEKIVGDLLDFARAKPPQRTPTLLGKATAAQLIKLGNTEGIRFEVDLRDSLPPVLADPTQLGQIILNLATNASQAMEGKGVIAIQALEDGARVHYEIRDSGPGIASDNLERIFEPLFTTKARGIGLGLSVSRTLARANGGDLTATSPPGAGATFRLTLEAAVVEAAV